MNKGAHLIASVAIGLSVGSNQASTTCAQPTNVRLSVYASIALQGNNSITGHVFGGPRQPLADVYVELLNDVYSTIDRAKTNGSGFYSFQHLPSGTYKVKVLPYGTDYAEQTQEVTLQSVSIVPGGGRDSQQLDFYLRVRANANSGPFAAPVGTIFVQHVPEEAVKLYEKGIRELREKREKDGFQSLKGSLEIFPNYYLALDRLGTEYVLRGYYEAARILLTKAIEVNPSSYSSVFGLGIAQYNLKQTNEAIENLRRATILYNKSADAYMWLGLAFKRAGKLDQSEAAFKRANELSKGKSAEVHWQTARLYSEQKRYSEAANELELYLKYQADKRDTEKIKQLIQQLREKAAKG